MLSARPAPRSDQPDGHLTRPGSRLAPLVLCICLLAASGVAQLPPALSTGAELSQKQVILLGILHLTAPLEDELKSKQVELQSPQAEGHQDELLQQIKTLAGRLSQLRRDLDEVASGVDLDLFKTQADADPDWQKRLYDLLGPLMNELIRLTARPREIEQLRTQSQRYQEQLQVVGRVLESISGLLTAHPDTALVSPLRQLQQDWQSRRQDIATQLGIVGQQLSAKLTVAILSAVSSLNIRILADFTGDAAPNYHILQRLLQRLSVEACTESGWDIPFSQLTLHMAPTAEKTPPSSP